MSPIVKCFRCETALEIPEDTFGQTKCPLCREDYHGQQYPALLAKPKPVTSGTRLIDDKEASCFNHPSKKAEVVCESCGRFLCALCATEFEDKQICLECLCDSQDSGKNHKLDNSRILYDDLALILSLLGCSFLFFLACFIGPAVIFLVLFKWRKGTTSVIRKSRIRYVIAFILALIQITVWAILILPDMV